jgi:hypothetical protein
MAVTRTMPAPTGDTIAAAIEREMQEHLYPLRHLTLAPAEYHIYLHPDDFAYVELIVPRIVEDIQTALNMLVQRLNSPSLWSRLTSGASPKPIEVPAGGWAIHIKPAINDEVSQGEIGIHSRLAVPANARFGTGAGTIRISETVVSGAERRTRTRTEMIPTDGLVRRSVSEGRAMTTDPSAVDEVPPPLPRPVTLSGPRLAYRDDSGEHVYPITKELIRIGRGGIDHWVDVVVATTAHVSREHCRIRRDAAGRLFIQDVSAWGTTVDGVALERASGTGAASEWELTDGATIRLADAVSLQLLLK